MLLYPIKIMEKKRKKFFFNLKLRWRWGRCTYLGRGVREDLAKKVPCELRPEEREEHKPAPSLGRRFQPAEPRRIRAPWRGRTESVHRTKRKRCPMKLDQSRGGGQRVGST